MTRDVEKVDQSSMDLSRRGVMGSSAVVAAGALGVGMIGTATAQDGPTDEISGTVTDTDGNAVEGATVVAVPHDSGLDALVTTTDATGAYSFGRGDLHPNSNLYHAVARDGTEADPFRSQQNYPFIYAEGVEISDSGLVHDYHATDLPESDGQTVQTWPDAVGSNDLTGGGPVFRSGEINGQDATEWDRTDDTLSGNPANYSSEFSLHAVWKIDSFSGTEIATVYNSADSQGANIQIDPSPEEVILGLSGETSLATVGIATGTTVLSARKASGAVADVLVNGSSTSGSDSTDPSPSGSSYMGSFDGTQRYMYDFIGRVLVYDTEQSSADFADTHEALRSMYGVL